MVVTIEVGILCFNMTCVTELDTVFLHVTTIRNFLTVCDMMRIVFHIVTTFTTSPSVVSLRTVLVMLV